MERVVAREATVEWLAGENVFEDASDRPLDGGEGWRDRYLGMIFAVEALLVPEIKARASSCAEAVEGCVSLIRDWI